MDFAFGILFWIGIGIAAVSYLHSKGSYLYKKWCEPKDPVAEWHKKNDKFFNPDGYRISDTPLIPPPGPKVIRRRIAVEEEYAP